MTTPKPQLIFSNQQIREYLLQKVTDEQQAEIEIFLIENADFLSQLRMVEANLMEDYLDKILSPEDTELFETKFLCHPQRFQELELTKALINRARTIKNLKIMKRDVKISASDNNLINESIKFILIKLEEFEKNTQFQDSNPAQNREELTILLPDGFWRESSELLNRAVFFDLVYSRRRLRFALEIGKKSNISAFTIESLLYNESTGFRSFIINQKLQMSVTDIRFFVHALEGFFQPEVYQVKTISNETFIPMEYVALRVEETFSTAHK